VTVIALGPASGHIGRFALSGGSWLDHDHTGTDHEEKGRRTNRTGRQTGASKDRGEGGREGGREDWQAGTPSDAAVGL